MDRREQEEAGAGTGWRPPRWYRAWREQAGGGDRGRRRAKLAPGLLAKAPVMLLLMLDFTFHVEDEQGSGCGRGNP